MTTAEKFFKKYQKVPIIEFENNVDKEPLVSVIVQTYQHVNYIAKCLEGILMQKTDFKFEVLVGEDDSSDGTRDICIKYAKKFPDKIKLFLHSRENNIRVDGKPTGLFNSRNNVFSSKGKYIAICEGDDFWIDPLKLQKQVNFLEANTDFGLVYSDITLIDEKGDKLKNTDFYDRKKKLHRSGFIFWNLLDSNFINTLTTCLKREIFVDYLDKFNEEFAYDYRIWLHLSSYYRIKYFDEKSASYRIHMHGMSRSKNFANKSRPLVRQSGLLNYLSIINYDSKLINKAVFSKILYVVLRNKNLTIQDKKPTIRLLLKHPKFLIYLPKILFKRIKTKIKS